MDFAEEIIRLVESNTYELRHLYVNDGNDRWGENCVTDLKTLIKMVDEWNRDRDEDDQLNYDEIDSELARAESWLDDHKEEFYASLATFGASHGWTYKSLEWQAFTNKWTPGGWSQYWPEVDIEGNILSNIIGDESGYCNVDDEAMISEDELTEQEIADCHENGYAPSLPRQQKEKGK